MRKASMVLGGLLVCLVTASDARAQDAASEFHRAYYLEVEEGNLEAAAALYAQIAGSNAPAELVGRARKRLAACRELIRGADLSQLMPPEVLSYVELRNPGEHLTRILTMAGLTPRAANDSGPDDSGLPVVVSPRLLKSLEAVPGMAVAVTNVHPRLGIPSVVAVLNLGRSDLAHGAVETALSTAVASGALQRGEAVEGHATYMSPYGTVVATERFVILGNPHQLVTDAVRRLHDDNATALGDTDAFKEVQAQRGQSLLFAFVNARRGVALAKIAMSGNRGLPEEYRIMQAFLDIESLDWAAVRIGTSDKGITADAWLRMDDDNHALAYHLVRTSPLGREALQAVPAGAAAFLALSLAPDGVDGGARGSRARAARYVTGLDFGREIFANIQDVLLFALPPSAIGDGGGHPEIPPVGLVLTARDATKSRALWETVLGVSAMISQEGRESVRSERVGDYELRVYEYPESVRIYFAALPDRVVLATSRAVVTAAIKAVDGSSVLDDEAFASALGAGAASGATKIVCVHAARMLEMAAPMMRMHPGEAQEISALLKDKTATVVTRESPSRVQLSVVVGLENLSEFVRTSSATWAW